MVRLLPSRGVQYDHEATIQTADGDQLRLSRPRLASVFARSDDRHLMYLHKLENQGEPGYRNPSLWIFALGLRLR
jgi:hypothetical protein